MLIIGLAVANSAGICQRQRDRDRERDREKWREWLGLVAERRQRGVPMLKVHRFMDVVDHTRVRAREAVDQLRWNPEHRLY